MISGSGSGATSLRKVSIPIARRGRNISSSLSSTPTTPLRVPTKGAKKQTSVTISSFEVRPKPKAAITIGPMAMRGVASRRTT